MKNNIKTKVNNHLEKTKHFLNKHKEAIITGTIGICAVATVYFLKSKEVINAEADSFFKDLEIKDLKDLITEKDFYHVRAIRDGAAYGSPICQTELRDYLQHTA